MSGAFLPDGERTSGKQPRVPLHWGEHSSIGMRIPRNDSLTASAGDIPWT